MKFLKVLVVLLAVIILFRGTISAVTGKDMHFSIAEFLVHLEACQFDVQEYVEFFHSFLTDEFIFEWNDDGGWFENVLNFIGYAVTYISECLAGIAKGGFGIVVETMRVVWTFFELIFWTLGFTDLVVA